MTPEAVETGGGGEVLVVHVAADRPASARGTAARADRGTDPRALRTRAAVVEAATTLFLRHGYQGTSVEDIASMATVSKRTVYNNFGDKERLFTDIVLGITATAEQFATELVGELHDVDDDIATALSDLARRHLAAVTRPQVLRLRRLIIAESGRFPQLAREYHRRAPGRVLAAIATALGSLADRGVLRVPDPNRAAEHFSFLVLGATLDRAMFEGPDTALADAERDRIAEDGVRAFLAAYARDAGPDGSS